MRSIRSGSTERLRSATCYRTHELVAIERRAAPVLLDHMQLAQLHALEGGEASPQYGTDAPAADRRQIVRRPHLHLSIEAAAIGAPHLRARPSFNRPASSIDGEPPGEFGDVRAHLRLDRHIPRFAVRRQAIQDLDNHSPDIGELLRAKAA